MRKKQAGPISTFIAGALFLTVGGVITYFFGWPIIVEAKASASWPSAPGTITVSKVDSHRGKNNTMYSHHIEYTYAVDGVQRKGNRVWVGDGASTSSPTPAKRTVSRYPVGSETTVFYDPAAPDVCALQTGTTWSSYLLFVFGGLFFLVGACLLAASGYMLLMGAMMIGAAATSVVGAAVIAKSPSHQPDYDRKPRSADDDDGIEIT